MSAGERAGDGRSSVSVVIPCFNRAAYVGEAIESALAQTRPPLEIVVVDDGSTDESVAVASRYPVTMLPLGTNRGVSAARNAGVAAARGDLIAMLDSDDRWGPRHLEVVAGLLDRHPEVAAAAGAGRVFGTGGGVFYPRFPPETPVDVFAEAFATWIVLPTVTVIRRSALVEVGGYWEGDREVEDYDLFLRLAERWPFVGTNEVTGHWRRHADQLSAGYHRQLHSVYRHRERFVRAVAAGGDAGRARELERLSHEVWVRDLTAMYQARDWPGYQAILGFHTHVPGVTRAERLRWTSLAWLAPAVEHVWDRLPRGVRRSLKRGLAGA